jgi:hypothetical protein
MCWGHSPPDRTRPASPMPLAGAQRPEPSLRLPLFLSGAMNDLRKPTHETCDHRARRGLCADRQFCVCTKTFQPTQLAGGRTGRQQHLDAIVDEWPPHGAWRDGHAPRPSSHDAPSVASPPSPHVGKSPALRGFFTPCCRRRVLARLHANRNLPCSAEPGPSPTPGLAMAPAPRREEAARCAASGHGSVTPLRSVCLRIVGVTGGAGCGRF